MARPRLKQSQGDHAGDRVPQECNYILRVLRDGGLRRRASGASKKKKNPPGEVACGKTEVEGIAKRSNWCTSYAETYKILLVR